MKKVLFVATVVEHLKAFHTPYIEYLEGKGYAVECATKLKEGIHVCQREHNVDFERNPIKLKNVKAFKKLKNIIDKGEYEFIHCHTPMGALLTRLAALGARRRGTRVIYTAHGFHFFKGAPVLNWLIYFPAEWFCSFFTDVLITINQEDYNFAKKHLHAKRTEYVHGVGVDTQKVKNALDDMDKKRAELGIPKDNIAVLSVGELNENKNHETVLRAIASLERKDITYVICGEGDRYDFLINLAQELGMADRLILSGYREDAAEICKCCDIFAFPSRREGLPVSVMEAMLAELPVVGSQVRGVRDLTHEGKSGFLYNSEDVAGFAQGIKKLAESKELRARFGEYGRSAVMPYTIENVIADMGRIYDSL